MTSVHYVTGRQLPTLTSCYCTVGSVFKLLNSYLKEKEENVSRHNKVNLSKSFQNGVCSSAVKCNISHIKRKNKDVIIT